MFIRLHPSTIVNDGGPLHPVGDRFYFNINRIGSARFRSSGKEDYSGQGKAADLVPLETPCVDIWIEGAPHGRAQIVFYFPGPLRTEYERVLQIIEHRVV
jgi:hypothetical protein